MRTVPIDVNKDSALQKLEIVETGRRRRWSAEAKERIILESFAAPRRISATAREHGITRSQLIGWRRAFLAEQVALAGAGAAFVPAVITADAATETLAAPAETTAPLTSGAAAPSAPPISRMEIALASGRRISVEGAVDVEMVLRVARGLERLR